jgi:cysteine synthase A
MKVYSDITKTIGRTPLIKMQRMTQGMSANLLFKLEFFNPLGSVKDRIGLNMIERAESQELLREGMEVLEPTSGNTGVALAFVCAAKGYPLTLVMPETMSMERKTLLLGAKVILTPGTLGMRGAVAKAMELNEMSPGHFFYTRQFENEFNSEIHRETTGPEIWTDTEGQVDVVVSGVGTGGTFTGCGQFLKSKKPSVRMVAVEPSESPILSGGKPGPHKIQGIGAGFVPKILNKKLIDEVIKVSTDDALKTAREVIRREGIPVGISSGAAVAAAFKLGKRAENQGKTIVTIIPSYTERYLSTLLAEEERKKAQDMGVQPVDDKWIQKVESLFKED